MKIKTSEGKARIKLLTDPQPSFMALVDHGACQTPFSVVKRVGKPVKETEMSKRGKGSKAPASKLTKMQFSKDKFKTVKSVKDYLAENGIEGAGKVEDGDDVWIVKSTEDFSKVKLEKARATPGRHEGVTAFIAAVKTADPEDEEEDEGEDTSKSLRDGEDEDGEEGEDGEEAEETDEAGEGEGDEEEEGEEEPTQKRRKAASKVKQVGGTETKVRRAPKPKKASADPEDEEDEGEEIDPVLDLSSVAKYDWWGAYTSGSDSLMGVLKDGMDYDNVPPGMDDVMMAAYITIGNVLSDDTDSATKLSALKQMGNELAVLTVGLFELFEGATEDSTKSLKPSVRKAAKKFSDSFAESVSRMVDGDFSVIANVDNDEGDDEKPARKTASNDDKVLQAVERLGSRLDKIDKRVTATDAELRRSTTRRSMSDSIGEIVDEDELLNEQDEEELEAAERLQEVRRAFGVSRPAPAPAVA